VALGLARPGRASREGSKLRGRDLLGERGAAGSVLGPAAAAGDGREGDSGLGDDTGDADRTGMAGDAGRASLDVEGLAGRARLPVRRATPAAGAGAGTETATGSGLA